MGNILASMAAYVASQERQAISRRTKAGLEKARTSGTRLGRPPRLNETQLTAIRQDLGENISVAAISKQYGIPRTTLRNALERSDCGQRES